MCACACAHVLAHEFDQRLIAPEPHTRTLVSTRPCDWHPPSVTAGANRKGESLVQCVYVCMGACASSDACRQASAAVSWCNTLPGQNGCVLANKTENTCVKQMRCATPAAVAHQIVDGNLLDYALRVYDEQAAQGNTGLLQQHSIAGSNGLRQQQQQLVLQQQHTGKVKAQHTMTQRDSSLLKKQPIAASSGLRSSSSSSSSSSSRKGHSTAQHDIEQYQPYQATLHSAQQWLMERRQ